MGPKPTSPPWKKPRRGLQPGKPISATPYSPAGNQGLRQQGSFKRSRCGPVFTQEETGAFRAVATYGPDQPDMLPRGYRSCRPSRRKPQRVRFTVNPVTGQNEDRRCPGPASLPVPRPIRSGEIDAASGVRSSRSGTGRVRERQPWGNQRRN